jgi:hypothetical protein
VPCYFFGYPEPALAMGALMLMAQLSQYPSTWFSSLPSLKRSVSSRYSREVSLALLARCHAVKAPSI